MYSAEGHKDFVDTADLINWAFNPIFALLDAIILVIIPIFAFIFLTGGTIFLIVLIIVFMVNAGFIYLRWRARERNPKILED